MAVAVIMAGDALLLTGFGARPEIKKTTAKPSPSPKAPTAWDERVLPLVGFVEEKRGLKFKQPVFVDFLTAEQYTKEVTGTELTKEDKEDIKQAEGLSRAFGLIKPETDLLKEAETLADEGTAAFYSSEDKRVRVRGTEMTPGLRATIVHELTHAVQDQHHDISRVDQLESPGAALAFTGLIEGDAIRIENQYVESLPEAESKALEAEIEAAPDGTSEVPPGLLALFSAGHALGETFVEFLVAHSGVGAIERAFKSPPSTEEHLFDPFTFLDSEAPRVIEEVKLEKGDKRFDEGDFGAVAWYVILALRIDPQLAVTAADGWGGDSYAAFQRGKQSCMRVNFIGDTPADTDEMLAALDAWTKATPGGLSSVVREGQFLKFSSCDPGKAAVIPERSDADDLMLLPLNRASFAAELLREGVSVSLARCASRRLTEAFSLEELASDRSLTRAEEARITKLMEQCV